MVNGNPCQRLALGTAQWGMPYGVANATGRPTLDEISAILEVARRAGVDTLDSARGYGDGEAVIGALTDGDSHWRIVTKLDARVAESGNDVAACLARVEASLEQSLEALRRDHIDVLLLHRAAHREVFDGAIWELLRRKREQGVILALGLSASTPAEAVAALEDPSLDCLQVAASLFDRRLARADFFRRARAIEKRVFVRSVFLQGVAHMAPEALPEHLARLGAPLHSVGEWTRERSLRRSDAFLLYARRLDCDRVVLGCETAGQLCQNLIAWRSLEIAPEELGNLVGRIGELDERLLDPSRWSELEGEKSSDLPPVSPIAESGATDPTDE